MSEPESGLGGAVTGFIIQHTAVADRSPEECAIVEEGLLPLAVFAEGLGQAFLIKTSAAHLEGALEDAAIRRRGPKEARIAFREALFLALADDVESGFGHASSLKRFPNDALRLFAEAVHQAGLAASGPLPACAIRFRRGVYAQPDVDTPLSAAAGL